MPDDFRDRRAAGGEERPAFGWGARRRMLPGDQGAGPRPEGQQPPANTGPAQPIGNPEALKLRPSGQLGRPSTGKPWGHIEPAAPPPPPGIPGQQRAGGLVRPAGPQPAPAPAPDAPQGGQLRPVRPVQVDAPGGRAQGANPVAEATKIRLHELLIEELEHGALEGLAPEQQREAVIKAARELLVQEGLQLGGMSRDELLEAVADEALGLGPLEPLLRDPSISEVMVNDIDKVYFEREGRIFRSPVRFRDKQHVMRIIERIVAPLGRRIDESSPMVDARLPDGSRVNITIPPASPKAPTITIRKFRADKMRMADLIAVGALSEQTAEFLAMCVRAHLNIIISGGTGTGKTTILNALSAFIPNTERIITIEDPAELRLQQDHVITLEARPASIEGKNQIKQRDLVRNCLRMRPDRIIVGEVRGEEAFDMLQAMNTGHDGSISTIHANNPREALSRLENMVLMAGMDLPSRAIREQIASAIHIFIQLSRLQDGSRKVTHVTEVSGMEGDTITLQDIFLFKLDRVDEDGKVHGSMRPTGIRPGFAHKFAIAGIELPNNLFGTGEGW
ncbi:CpaF family protein [Tepidiforma sp.]|jgi:pilus assembly protein CpaF|uniref:CpaF family protein n=1 Tax=Tepidiforma sp. TaxID=2682230 RepID=UPI00263774C8|nr:CpaF family protein [Tepidiforma sp.]MCX7618266.1 CpaF family protein [Tepidiforma sp.]